jgi:hypothetical protein
MGEFGPRIGLIVTASGVVNVSIFADSAEERRAAVRLLEILTPRLDELEDRLLADLAQDFEENP